MASYGNVISCGWALTAEGGERIFIHEGITAIVVTDFPSPAAPIGNPTGLTFDGTNLISLDVNASRVYIHQGKTQVTTADFLTPAWASGSNQHGLAYDGTNLISSDVFTNRIYLHDGITSGTISTFASPASDPQGLTFDGVNLISSDRVTDRIYLHQGLTNVITTSFASPANWPTDLAFDSDENNLLSGDRDTLLIYVHSGITSTILRTFAAPIPGRQRGLTYDNPWFVPNPPTGLLVNDLASSIGDAGECIPVEISTRILYFSAIYHDDAGDIAIYYRIQVNTQSDFEGTMFWDSGKTSMSPVAEGERCANIDYAGDPLTVGTTHYWRIKFWDDDDNEGLWSVEPACFMISPGAPYNLLCEQKTNPVDVTDPQPEFSAINP